MTKLNIAVIGAQGRMGRAIVAALEELDHGFAGALGRDNAREWDAILGPADAVIDFAGPGATARHAARMAALGKPYLVGTTGLTSEDVAALAGAARTIPILQSYNMSLGVNLLAALVEQAARALGPEWDIEILEMHHRHKADAPSGTALMLGQAAARGRGIALADHQVLAREGLTGPRPEGAIGFGVLRGGSVAGDHDVLFAGPDEVLRLSHHAGDRRIFARGAVKAAAWLAAQPPGLYDMRAMLGLGQP